MEDNIKILFLDDTRFPKDVFGDVSDHEKMNFDVARNYRQFTKLVEDRLEIYDLVTFDHDLGDEGENERTGKDAAYFMLEFAMNNNKELPKFSVHSSNPTGAEKIKQMLEKYTKYISIKELSKIH